MTHDLKRLFAALSLLTLIPMRAFAFDNFKEFPRDRWDFELSTDYFRSEANYPSGGGSQQSLPSGNSYTLMNFTLGTRYIPDRDWSIFAATNLGNAEAKNSISTRSTSSLTWAYAGADFLIYSGAVDLVPEISLLVPFEKVDGKGDSALNTEGAVEGRARITMQKNFGVFRGFGYIGFTVRSDDRSYLMPWGVGGDLNFANLRLGAELFGYQSVTDDKDKGNPTTRNAYLNTVNAGSFMFYSVNPSLVNAQFYGQLFLTPAWSLKVGGGTTLAGENAAAGFNVGALVRYSYDLGRGYRNVEPDYKSSVPSTQKTRSNMYYYEDEEISSDRTVPQFKEDTNDGVDQKLFKPKKPKSNKSLEQQNGSSDFNVELKSKKKKRKK